MKKVLKGSVMKKVLKGKGKEKEKEIEKDNKKEKGIKESRIHCFMES